MDMIMGIATQVIFTDERGIIEPGKIVYVPVADIEAEAEQVRLGRNVCQVSDMVVPRSAVDIEPRWRELGEYERKHYTRGAQHMTVCLRDMGREALLDVARGGETNAALMELWGPMNPSWLAAMAAEIAYDQGLIDETELDAIAD